MVVVWQVVLQVDAACKLITVSAAPHREQFDSAFLAQCLSLLDCLRLLYTITIIGVLQARFAPRPTPASCCKGSRSSAPTSPTVMPLPLVPRSPRRVPRTARPSLMLRLSPAAVLRCKRSNAQFLLLFVEELPWCCWACMTSGDPRQQPDLSGSLAAIWIDASPTTGAFGFCFNASSDLVLGPGPCVPGIRLHAQVCYEDDRFHPIGYR